MENTRGEIIHFSRIVRKAIEDLGIDMDSIKGLDVVHKISLAAMDYASEFHRQAMKG